MREIGIWLKRRTVDAALRRRCTKAKRPRKSNCTIRSTKRTTSAYSRLAYSTDFGETWTRQEFDTHTSFPYPFYSRPGQALQVAPYDGIVYQLQNRVGKKWKVAPAIAELNKSVNKSLQHLVL